MEFSQKKEIGLFYCVKECLAQILESQEIHKLQQDERAQQDAIN